MKGQQRIQAWRLAPRGSVGRALQSSLLPTARMKAVLYGSQKIDIAGDIDANLSLQFATHPSYAPLAGSSCASPAPIPPPTTHPPGYESASRPDSQMTSSWCSCTSMDRIERALERTVYTHRMFDHVGLRAPPLSPAPVPHRGRTACREHDLAHPPPFPVSGRAQRNLYAHMCGSGGTQRSYIGTHVRGRQLVYYRAHVSGRALHG